MFDFMVVEIKTQEEVDFSIITITKNEKVFVIEEGVKVSILDMKLNLSNSKIKEFSYPVKYFHSDFSETDEIIGSLNFIRTEDFLEKVIKGIDILGDDFKEIQRLFNIEIKNKLENPLKRMIISIEDLTIDFDAISNLLENNRNKLNSSKSILIPVNVNAIKYKRDDKKIIAASVMIKN